MYPTSHTSYLLLYSISIIICICAHMICSYVLCFCMYECFLLYSVFLLFPPSPPPSAFLLIFLHRKCWWLLKGKHIMLEHTNLLTFTWKLVPWKKQSEWTLGNRSRLCHFCYVHIFISPYVDVHIFLCVHAQVYLKMVRKGFVGRRILRRIGVDKERIGY